MYWRFLTVSTKTEHISWTEAVLPFIQRQWNNPDK